MSRTRPPSRARLPRASAAALICLTSAACGSGSGVDSFDAGRDCGYSVSWNHRLYLGLAYVLRAPQTREDVVAPTPGRTIGHGFVPQCPGDTNGTPATVFAVPGVSSDVAVLANTDPGVAPELCIRQGRPIPDQLLRSG